jgi:hypothetical protein
MIRMKNSQTLRNRVVEIASLKYLFVLIVVLSGVGYAQESKPSGDGATGEYGVVTSSVGSIRNTSAVLLGGRGGWIVSPTFSIGIAGYALMNDVSARLPDTSGNRFMTMSYGGIDLEYTFAINNTWFLTFQELIGAGSISHKESPYLNKKQYHDPFAVFEPSLSIEVGVAKIFRIGIGASYRDVEWLESSLATKADLGGPSAFVSLKIGFL